MHQCLTNVEFIEFNFNFILFYLLSLICHRQRLRAFLCGLEPQATISQEYLLMSISGKMNTSVVFSEVQGSISLISYHFFSSYNGGVSDPFSNSKEVFSWATGRRERRHLWLAYCRSTGLSATNPQQPSVLTGLPGQLWPPDPRPLTCGY